MNAFITVLILVVCFLLIIVVLVQNPKGGGLASGFSAANQIGGVRKTTDFLEKATWGLLVVLVLLSLFTGGRRQVSDTTAVDRYMDEPLERVSQPVQTGTNPDALQSRPQEGGDE
jgi:preprotein translocase subunit SecG